MSMAIQGSAILGSILPSMLSNDITSLDVVKDIQSPVSGLLSMLLAIVLFTLVLNRLMKS